MKTMLSVEGLTVTLPGENGEQTLIRDVDLTIPAGTVLGVAGESGSGKTMTALALLGLLPAQARATGRVFFDGVESVGPSGPGLADRRGKDVAMVFQDPMTALHPMLTIERQLTEHMRHHLKVSKQEARARAVALMEAVRIPDGAGALKRYPHQFSGGMRQRIAIAMALACDPRVLILDEPTTALDVTVQAGIIRLLDRLRREKGLTVMLITHDLGLLSSIADRIQVFYAGRCVESGTITQVLGSPRHPYTRGLIDALPDTERNPAPLKPIPGSPPAVGSLPDGCAFHPRCDFATDDCRAVTPTLIPLGEERLSACPVDPFVEASAR